MTLHQTTPSHRHFVEEKKTNSNGTPLRQLTARPSHANGQTNHGAVTATNNGKEEVNGLRVNRSRGGNVGNAANSVSGNRDGQAGRGHS